MMHRLYRAAALVLLCAMSMLLATTALAMHHAESELPKLNSSNADEQYQGLYKLFRKHQAKGLAIQIKANLHRCHKKDRAGLNKCKAVFEDTLALFTQLQKGISERLVSPGQLAKFYCAEEKSAKSLDESTQNKYRERCRRSKRLHGYMQQSPVDLVNNALSKKRKD